MTVNKSSGFRTAEKGEGAISKNGLKFANLVTPVKDSFPRDPTTWDCKDKSHVTTEVLVMSVH